DDARWSAFCRKRDAVEAESARLASVRAAPGNPLGAEIAATLGVQLSRETSALDLLRRPEVDYNELMRGPRLGPGVDDPVVAEQVEVQVRYAGYLQRQDDEIARQRRHEDATIPGAFDYAAVRGLSSEVQAKLSAARPQTVGQAARISGVTPA